MRYELKSIPLWPFIRIAFFCNLVAGFIIGLLYVPLLGMVMQVVGQSPLLSGQGMSAESVPFGLLIIIVPIIVAFFTAFFWTLFEIVMIVLYNLLTRMVGGLELNLQPIIVPAPPEPAARPMYAQASTPDHLNASTPPPPPPPSPQVETKPARPQSLSDAEKRWPSPYQPPDSDNS